MSDKMPVDTVMLDGRRAAERMRRDAQADLQALGARRVTSRLVVLRVGEDLAAREQVASLIRHAAAWCMEVVEEALPGASKPGAVLRAVKAVGRDTSVDALLLARPLPRSQPARPLEAAVPPAKDVDGVHPESVGRALEGRPILVPSGVLALRRLVEQGAPAPDARVVVLGARTGALRLGALALHDAGWTVTLVAPGQPDSAALCADADVLVVATGFPRSVGREHVKRGGVVIDTGVHAETDERGRLRLVGDVDAPHVDGIAGALTPVPGGLGPAVTAARLFNTVRAARGARPPDDPGALPLFHAPPR